MKKSLPPAGCVNLRHVKVLLAFSISVCPAADLLRWDVNGTSGITGSGDASVLAAGVSGSPLTGNGATGMASTPANTWNRNFPPFPDAASAMAGTDTASRAYFEFSTSAAPGHTVSISGMTGLNLTRTSVGPTTAALFYSTDGGETFQQTGTDFAVPINSLANSSAAPNFSQTMAVTPIVIPGGSTVHWRIAGFGSTTANRLGIGKASTDDFTLTGTSVPDVATHNLLWTGAGGADWNVSPANLNWSDTDLANAPAAFRAGDNVAINTPGTVTVAARGVSAGKVAVGNPTGTVTFTGGAITAISLAKSGAGTAEFNGINEFPGGVTLTGGTLRIGTSVAAGTGAFGIDGGTLRTGADVFSVDNPISLGAAGGTFEAEGEVTFSAPIGTTTAVINTAHVLTKTGAGHAILAGTGTTALGSQMTIGVSGGAVELDIPAGSLTFTGSGQRNLGGTSTWDAPVTLNGGVLMLHGGAIEGTGVITVAGNTSVRSRLNFNTAAVSNPVTVSDGVILSLDSANGTNALVIHGPVTGGGNVTKTGNGTVRIESDCSWTGVTVVEAGTLRVGNGSTGSIGTSEVTLTAGTFFLNRDDLYTFPNIISGAGNVQVSTGAGTTTLTGQNSWTGTTTVTTGRLLIDGDSSAANGAVSLNTGAVLGGNGRLGGAVTLKADAGFAPRIRNWSGTVAGTDYDDLEIGQLDAAGVSIKLLVDTAGLTGFTETARTFTFLKTTGGITNFNPENVIVTAPGFPGTGTWTTARSGSSLQLIYTPAATGATYQTWAAGAPWNLAGADALPGADPDHDGISNALEFVLGGNPATVNDSEKLPAATVSGPNVVFTFRRSIQSAYLNPAAQYSTDLNTWITAQDGANGVSTTVTPGIAPGVDSVAVTIPVNPAGSPEFFVRLQTVVP
ncbi:MAG: autotransporter-associated beta strand repeat-containing protein [Verrucomicrobiota bacterium]